MAQDKFTIGRDPSADILIPEPSISRIHAEISLIGMDEVVFQDLQSSNGSYLVRGNQDERITQGRLRHDEKVKLGNVEVFVRDLITAARKQLAAQAAAAAAQQDKAVHRSVKMVRCQCGAVKEAGAACPYCGQ
jgi:pSer/pThr/pTyr-binding forkhead associated (FHA) protein